MSLFGREVGARLGGGGPMTGEMLEQQRKDRLKSLTNEVFDIKNDPYLLKNHMGQFECKLCYTLHRTTESYALHTEAKKHKENLKKRGHKMAKDKHLGAAGAAPVDMLDRTIALPVVPRIGTPAYKVFKQVNHETGAHSLLFRVHYPDIAEGMRPRYQVVSAYEQKVVPTSDKAQYIVFAAEPYEPIGVEVPNIPVRKDGRGVMSQWNPDTHTFTLQIGFKDTYGSAHRPSADTIPDHTRMNVDPAASLWQTY